MSEPEDTRWDRFVKWVRSLFTGDGRRKVAARWALAIVLFVVSLLVFVFFGWLLRGAGLWGDLAFAIVLTTGIFWIARQAAAFFLGEDAAGRCPEPSPRPFSCWSASRSPT